MGAITTPSITSLISRLQSDFPTIRFVQGDTFRWTPKNSTVYYKNDGNTTLLLHEVAHAMLQHTTYLYDIDLVKMERDAWEAAVSLAHTYHAPLDDSIAEEMLDSYRNWLHDRSVCPSCQATGLQTAPRTYSCLACSSQWRVNEARLCTLRRYKLQK